MKKIDQESIIRLRSIGCPCTGEWTLYDVTDWLREAKDIHIWVETRYNGQKEHLYYIGIVATVNGGAEMIHHENTYETDIHDTALEMAIAKAVTILSEY